MEIQYWQLFNNIKIKNQLLSRELMAIAVLFSGSLQADESENSTVSSVEYQPYMTIGVTQNKDIDINDFYFTDQSLATDFGIGLIKPSTLGNDWLFSQSIELNYASSTFSGSFTEATNDANEFINADGKHQELAVIGRAKLKKLNVFENVAPYLEASVSLINARSRFDSPFESQGHRQWKLGYQLSTGLEFNIGEGNSISFGIGFADDKDI